MVRELFEMARTKKACLVSLVDDKDTFLDSKSSLFLEPSL